MSSRKAHSLTLSPKARQDFIDILRYTGETWGHDQLLLYRDKLNDALKAVAGNPQLGHHRDDLPSTHSAYLVGARIIPHVRRGRRGRSHPPSTHELGQTCLGDAWGTPNRVRGRA